MSGNPPARATLSASALKAYAHPLRLEIIRHLNDHGPATSATLARALGESTGQTSYHLRQLARHGLVVEQEGRGTARERWWRPASVDVDAGAFAEDPGTAEAAHLMLATMVRHRAEALQRWVSRTSLPEEWRRANHLEATLALHPDELDELNEALAEVVKPFVERSRARKQSAEGWDRPFVRLYVDAFPLLED